MSINNVLSLQAPRWEALIQLTPEDFSDRIYTSKNGEKKDIYGNISNFLLSQQEEIIGLSKSEKCSLEDRVKAIEHLDTLGSSLDALGPSYGNNFIRWIKEVQSKYFTYALTQSNDPDSIVDYFMKNAVRATFFCELVCQKGADKELSHLLQSNKYTDSELAIFMNIAIENNHLSCVKLLLTVVDVSSKDEDKAYLAHATKTGHLQIAKELCEKGANILQVFQTENNEITCNKITYPPLAIAMHQGYEELVNYLGERGALSPEQIRPIFYAFLQLIYHDLDLLSSYKDLSQFSEENLNVYKKKLDDFISLTKKNFPFFQKTINFFSEHPKEISQLSSEQLRQLKELNFFYFLRFSEGVDLPFSYKEFSMFPSELTQESPNKWELIVREDLASLTNPSLHLHDRLSLRHFLFLEVNSLEGRMFSFLFGKEPNSNSVQIGPSGNTFFPTLQLLRASWLYGFKKWHQTLFSDEVKRSFAKYIVKKVVQEMRETPHSEVLKVLCMFAEKVLTEEEVKESIEMTLKETRQ